MSSSEEILAALAKLQTSVDALKQPAISGVYEVKFVGNPNDTITPPDPVTPPVETPPVEQPPVVETPPVVTPPPVVTTPTPDPTPDPEPTPDPDPVPTPEPVKVFGPNGKHYPPNSPDPRSPGNAVIIRSAPSGAAIRAALNALTPEQIDQGVIIALNSGQVNDNWAALNGYHNDRTNRITICPAGGFGKVTTSTAGILITNAHGLTFTGFDFYKLQLKGCVNTSVARSIVDYNYVSISTTAGYSSSGCGLYEVVMLDAQVKSADSAQLQNQASGTVLDGVTIAGCVLAPSYYVDGNYGGTGQPDRPHTDTLQITSSSSAPTKNVSVVDTQIWASNNSAMILSGPISNTKYEHTLIVGGNVAQVRYPFLQGGAGYPGAICGPGSLSAIQGNGDGTTDAYESVFIGSLSPDWATVENTKTNLTTQTSHGGSFIVDRALANYTDADFTALGAVKPTREAITQLWDYTL